MSLFCPLAMIKSNHTVAESVHFTKLLPINWKDARDLFCFHEKPGTSVGFNRKKRLKHPIMVD